MSGEYFSIMGAVMHFQRTLNRFSRENVPGYLAVFIGGFGDMFAGCLSRVEKGFPGFLPGVAYATAYYHWDGGGCGVFFDRCGKIAVELEELRRRYPGLPVVLIGHSYGGSCAVEVARRQSVQAAPLCLLTIDAVARRQKSVRPACAEWWGNAYLRDGGGFMDAVPRIGGDYALADTEENRKIEQAGHRQSRRQRSYRAGRQRSAPGSRAR